MVGFYWLFYHNINYISEEIVIMKISILQPKIERGNISANLVAIQKLINQASGDLLILAEYALTGSLVLKKNVNIQKWATDSKDAIQSLSIPKDKELLINSLIKEEDCIYNACSILPSYQIAQIKTYLDKLELESGICAGDGISVMHMSDKKIIIIICSDLKEINRISTEGADFILFIFHFTVDNYEKVMTELVNISKVRGIPILTASLTSDKNYGHSCYIFSSTVISLGNEEGILEVTI